ncbi:hypothetical protein M405DRAFT_55734 [Rhizopogon salebrosus TDB-379]|nr:hypothetical protein M405DRAFT_55734 [Rhizopogon salebrosus TDB-379]
MSNLQPSAFMSISSSLLRTSLPVSDSLKARFGAFSSSGVKPVMSSASPTVFVDALVFSSAMMSFISFVLSVTARSGSFRASLAQAPYAIHIRMKRLFMC